MNGFARVAVYVALMSVIGFTAQAQEKITGTWDVTFDYNGNEIAASISIAKNSDDTLVGLWIRGEEWANLTDVKFENGKLTFSRTLDMQGQKIQLQNEATFEGTTVKGKIISPQGELIFSGAKRKSTAPPRRRGGGRGGRRGFDIEALIKANDANGDGLLQKDEAPEQMQQFFGMLDANGDGGVSKEEADEVMKRFQRNDNN